MSSRKNFPVQMAQTTLKPGAVGAEPLELTRDEERMVLLYRATCEDQQHIVLGVAEDYARIYARYKRPALRLINGGAA